MDKEETKVPETTEGTGHTDVLPETTEESQA